ncbi:hypothetical protein KJ688_14660 [bacterium]|nr:hypothetical protein [bacterium]
MNKNQIIIASFLILFSAFLFAEDLSSDDQIIYLKNGDKITGTIIETNAQTGDVIVETKYGKLTVNQENILEEVVSIELKSGDKLKGRILSKNDKTTDLLSEYGLLKINNTDIVIIEYGLQDKGRKIAAITDKFAQSNERQIDVFYDPTGYTLDKGTLYVSGLSWGFGITDKFQITSKWSGYIVGNFNIRPKLQLFRFGTLEKEHVFAVGGHVHTRNNPDKYEWIEKEYLFEKGHWDESMGQWTSTGGDTMVYYGAYNKIGTKIKVEDEEMRFNTEYNEIDDPWVNTGEPEYNPYYEVFAAYTFSKARKGNTGRISHTLGAVISKHPDKDELMYKAYYAGGIDMRKNLILNYEIYYDPYYVEWWNRADGLFGIFQENLTMQKPEKHYVSPVHFDVGFIYAVTDWLRFGIHFQPYIFGIYMKF